MRQSFVWRNRPPSSRVVDRRTSGRGIKYGGIGSLIALILCLFGINLPDSQPQQGVVSSVESDEMARFASVILRDTEDVWSEQFLRMNRTYRKPELVLFTGEIDSACGVGRSSSGPFYCPADRRLYLDLEFYREMGEEFGVDGEFARAYVIAHEVGHHVQNLLGVTKRGGDPVQIELQADFLAGVWAHHAEKRWKFLQGGDIDEALRLAAAIGDDAMQRRTSGQVNPDRFTHGTSEQRVRWFRTGLKSGKLADGKLSGIR